MHRFSGGPFNDAGRKEERQKKESLPQLPPVSTQRRNQRTKTRIQLPPFHFSLLHTTIVQNSQEPRREYWATRLSVCSFTFTTHLLAGSALLALLACSAALIRLLARSLTPELLPGKVNS